MPGYTSTDSKTERDWEAKFRALPEAKRAHENMKTLAAHPHNVGSEAQRKNAE
jgi:N-acetylated-alpha-linked acidic dipeptidase